MTAPRNLDFPADAWITDLLAQALREDIGTGDATTTISVPASLWLRGIILARKPGVIAGLPLVEMVYARLDPEVVIAPLVQDGEALQAGQHVARVQGPAASLLTGERVALNFLQRLSGVASLTAQYVAAVAGTECRVLDTRKTLPGYRALDKYAVRAGGGHNHRMGLYDRIMLKDNHWTAAQGTMLELVREARREYPDLAIEIEVDNLEQCAQILPLDVEWVLLDNFTPAEICQAVQMRNDAVGARRTLLEASGNIDLGNVGRYAATGVDAVSIGRLTHSAPALDLSLELEPVSPTGVRQAP